MKSRFLLAGSVMLATSSLAAAPPKKAAAPKDPPPIATYTIDAATQSGLGMGMMGMMGAGMGAGMGAPGMAPPGAYPGPSPYPAPNPGPVIGGTAGVVGSVLGGLFGGGKRKSAAPPPPSSAPAAPPAAPANWAHTLDLRLASRTAPTGTPEANHLIPPAMTMGASLPLVTPPKPTGGPVERDEPVQMGKPEGKMKIYWGCGDHVGASQPLVFDFAQMAAGKVPPNVQAFARMAGRTASRSRFFNRDAPGFGEWPNSRDPRPVPPRSSLVGDHQVQSNYAPTMAFTLAPGQDFMQPMNLVDAGYAPSGADQLRWNAVPGATGYALAMFGATEDGTMVMWSSSKSPSMANIDYLSPSEAAKAVAAGDALAPSVTQCLLPAEVARMVPMGMVMGIAYGPEYGFSDKPKAPTWVATLRLKSTASLMRGMPGF